MAFFAGSAYVLHAQTFPCDSALIPEIFTPNHDGVNDLFVIPCIDLSHANTLIIFDRAGQEVFRAAAYENTWDGTWNETGTDLPDGTYFYALTADRGLPTEKTYKGSITIRR